MACYIASNNNRFYVARESGYGTIAAVTAANRFPATRLGMNEVSEKVRRRDKTGTRTYQGLPTELRRRTAFEVEAYLSSRGSGTEVPRYGALLESAMGGTARVSSGGDASIQGLVLTFAGGTRVERRDGGDGRRRASAGGWGIGPAAGGVKRAIYAVDGRRGGGRRGLLRACGEPAECHAV
jgi:hypothetical protein